MKLSNNKYHILLGHCPTCNGTNYVRTEFNPDGDTILTNCECDCGEKFEEQFEILFIRKI